MADLVTGRKSSISGVVTQMTNSHLVADRGVQLISDKNNSERLWIGPSGLTADSADATDGFPLEPGDSLLVPVRKVSDIYVRSTSAGNQKLWWVLI